MTVGVGQSPARLGAVAECTAGILEPLARYVLRSARASKSTSGSVAE
jgi:hypothetical protein